MSINANKKLRKKLVPMAYKSLLLPGQYILGSRGHFVAVRVLENECLMNFGHRRHEWVSASFKSELKANRIRVCCYISAYVIICVSQSNHLCMLRRGLTGRVRFPAISTSTLKMLMPSFA